MEIVLLLLAISIFLGIIGKLMLRGVMEYTFVTASLLGLYATLSIETLSVTDPRILAYLNHFNTILLVVYGLYLIYTFGLCFISFRSMLKLKKKKIKEFVGIG